MKQYADGEVHYVQKENPQSFRNYVYLYARRHGLKAKSYITWTSLPHPTVVFRLGDGPQQELPDAPPRGIHSHRKETASV